MQWKKSLQNQELRETKARRGKLWVFDLFGMERDSVAFAVEHNRAVTVGSDLVLRFENLAAVGRDRGDRLVQAAVGVKI